MIKLSYDLDLTPLVEVHNEKELNTALELKARLIGVNNRNLKTLKTDLKTSKDLAKYTKDATFISESGIFEKSQLDELYSLGYKGFLIGTSFMKTNDPANALKSFLGK
jgi:indole-3-glycerol phosphate synthase